MHSSHIRTWLCCKQRVISRTLSRAYALAWCINKFNSRAMCTQPSRQAKCTFQPWLIFNCNEVDWTWLGEIITFDRMCSDKTTVKVAYITPTLHLVLNWKLIMIFLLFLLKKSYYAGIIRISPITYFQPVETRIQWKLSSKWRAPHGKQNAPSAHMITSWTVVIVCVSKLYTSTKCFFLFRIWKMSWFCSICSAGEKKTTCPVAEFELWNLTTRLADPIAQQ